jgi:hypothetical protein
VPRSARSEARSLELIIRAAVAEERLFTRRLDRVAQAQQRSRSEIERELRHEHFGHLPESWAQRNGSTSPSP